MREGTLLPWMLLVWVLLETAVTQESPVTPPSRRMQHFKFKSRKIGGKKIAVVSLKLDPERGRRSILVPDGEGLLHPYPYAPLRHRHRFLPPFEDEERFSLNSTIAWDALTSKNTQELPGERTEVTAKEPTAAQMLRQIDSSLAGLEHRLEEEKQKESNVSKKKKKRKSKKNKRKRKDKKRGKKKEKRKNRKGKNKKKSKQRLKMIGEEACQFKVLKKCAKNLGLLPKRTLTSLSDYEKCDRRKEFLECVENKRNPNSCKKRSVARGDMAGLRSWIKKLFWTSNSCLLNESIRGT